MSRRARLALAVAAFVLVAIAPAGAMPAKSGLKVTSTLDGKKVLPRRIHWIARTSGPASEVDFLIDGKLRWVEHNAPYSYSEDDGYLVTSWLTKGRHRFSVRAVTGDGTKVTKTVVASVPAAPDVPAELAGSWERTVPDSVPPDPAYPGDSVPAGTWRIVFDKRWIEDHFPGKFNPKTSPKTGAGNVLLDDYSVGARTFSVYGAVTTGLLDIGFGGSPQGGGWWCGPGGPKARYSWSVSGDDLTLRAIGGDACSQRGGVMDGTWMRVGHS